MAGEFIETARAEALDRRAKKLAQREIAVPEENSGSAPSSTGKGFTGFLLQSSIVSRWRGIEIRAYGSTEPTAPQLKPLRIERLTPTLLLAIFQGTVEKIVLREPPQGLRFGVEPGDLKTTLRTLSGRDPGKPFKASFQVTMRPHYPRVIDAAATALKLANTKGIALPTGQSALNSADFAVEMVLSAASAIFNIKPGPKS